MCNVPSPRPRQRRDKSVTHLLVDLVRERLVLLPHQIGHFARRPRPRRPPRAVHVVYLRRRIKRARSDRGGGIARAGGRARGTFRTSGADKCYYCVAISTRGAAKCYYCVAISTRGAAKCYYCVTISTSGAAKRYYCVTISTRGAAKCHYSGARGHRSIAGELVVALPLTLGHSVRMRTTLIGRRARKRSRTLTFVRNLRRRRDASAPSCGESRTARRGPPPPVPPCSPPCCGPPAPMLWTPSPAGPPPGLRSLVRTEFRGKSNCTTWSTPPFPTSSPRAAKSVHTSSGRGRPGG
eukprot:947996-Prorocentrum_minimum.AAC.1